MIYKGPYAKVLAEITSKCWQDADFKQRFLSDPKTVIQEHGIEVPEGLGLKIVEDPAPNMLTLHLPPAPNRELSDEDLEAVSGGKSGDPSNNFRVQ